MERMFRADGYSSGWLRRLAARFCLSDGISRSDFFFIIIQPGEAVLSNLRGLSFLRVKTGVIYLLPELHSVTISLGN